jgi:hypothetical protein
MAQSGHSGSSLITQKERKFLMISICKCTDVELTVGDDGWVVSITNNNVIYRMIIEKGRLETEYADGLGS